MVMLLKLDLFVIIFLKDYGEADRIWCSKVEVRETDSNMAMKVGHREDGEFDE